MRRLRLPLNSVISDVKMNELDKTIAKLEDELALPNGFFDELKNEEDWSFIVKCHALMESACSFLLTAYFGNSNYEDIFSRLEMSDKKKGKVAFLRAAGLIVPEEASFIRGLSELRNKVVHNIRGIAFRFSEYVASLDENQKRAFLESFGYAYMCSDKNGKLVLKDSEDVFKDPKAAVFNSVKLVLAIIKLQVERHRFEREAAEHQIRIYELMNSLTERSGR